MDIRLIPGKKAQGDTIILARTDGWEAVTLEDLGWLVKYWCDNENRIYPPEDGYQGGGKVLTYLLDCIRMGVKPALQRHELEPRRKAVRQRQQSELIPS